MELKEYQWRALDAFTRWREALEQARQASITGAEALEQAGVAVPADVRNYPKSAWEALTRSGGLVLSAGAHVDRTATAGYPIPHICFKVPTGGGKTLLAAAALERLNRQTGLTLWITPTRAIYQQTKDALWSREHPYRQMLERASGGRVKMLEKEDPFTAADVANYLCVMLLMLPATNRQRGRDFLRMFRDSGRYPTFFPDSDDALGDGRLLELFPDLERASDDGPVKHSLFNVFKMLRPVVVLDEAHKAYGQRKQENNEEFVRSVNRLNPRLVIELSATPNRNISNLLVDISGVDLKAEEMIKLPVRVTSFTQAEWQYTLGQAAEELERLDAEAVSLHMSEGRYIRPIAVVRVERTGRDQRDGERVHAEDVREYLIQNLGVPAEAVRVKSAQNDELGREDLLSEFSQVRWIITKAALMEGWDCPFAYLLVMLDNTRAQRAITQLVGRVMRQPHARRTGREPLDQCHVYCWNTDVGKAVQRVKNGLEAEGLTGLDDDVWSSGGLLKLVTVRRREPFRNQNVFLPRVQHTNSDGWCELDYRRHILPNIEWGAIPAPDPQLSLPDSAKRQTASVDIGDERPVFYRSEELHIDKTVRLSYFTRRLSDIVPNPWQAARVAQDLLQRLREAGQSNDHTYDRRAYLAFGLREHVVSEVERQAERVFGEKLLSGDIRFDLTAGDNFRMVHEYSIPVAADEPTLEREYGGGPMQLSLFEPIFKRHFDTDLERKFAFYLDEQKALQWWHRIAVRKQHEYYLRGWRNGRIYPDFIAMGSETFGNQLLVFETKGGHLQDNPDTAYKQRVFKTLEKAFNDGFDAGKVTVKHGPAEGVFRLVFSEAEFPAALASLREASSA